MSTMVDPAEEIKPYDGIDPANGLIVVTTLPGRAEDFTDGRVARWDDLAAMGTAEAPVWIHLDRTKPRAKQWITEEAGLDPLVAEALLAEETRPRGVERGGGFLVILRGVNLNAGAEPDDLIAIRMWIEPRRIITLRQFHFHTVRHLRARAQESQAPASPVAMAVAVARGLTSRLWPVVENLQSLLDETEALLAEESVERVDSRTIAVVRRQAITLRRFLAPQRDTLASLAITGGSMFSDRTRAEVLELVDQTARIVEDLEEVRDRAAVSQDELRAQRELRSARTTYLLTLVAAVFLPLGLLTGLLGINVGGIPGTDSPWAFWVVSGGLVALAVGLVWLFKRLRWL